MPDPYTTPDKLRAVFGALDADDYTAQGTVDPDAFWVARIEEGDRWLDGRFACIGRAPIPLLEADRSPAMIVTLGRHAAVVALYFAVLGAADIAKGIRMMWELTEQWIACGALMGDESDSPPELASVISLDAADVCPAVPEKVWNELVPCAGSDCAEAA